ncbi:MAG: TlpA disulfide reductase family protein [Nitrospirota bacterium]
MNKWVIILGMVMVMLATGMETSFSEPTPSPDFQVELADGKIITKKSLEGKPALLMLWASWCGVCQRELPNLKKLHDQVRGKNIQILAIGTQDIQANINRYVKDHSDIFTFPVAYDRGNIASTAYNVRGVPTFVLLDEKGEIAYKHVGGGFSNDPALIKFIEGL